MRNLKKILALVLALVMSLSLMATASAADFPDADKITEKYQTAVEVLTGLEVFKGDADGSFHPEKSISRAETAAIIYRIVTGDVKDEQVGIYADYNIFDDVPSTAWYAGYVNFCANAEYIKGRTDGTFNPQGQVTGYAALAMILRAIGYTANGGFTGPDWEVQTARTAEARKITKNIMTGTLGQPASRETVAEILFQAILVNMVDHNVDNTFNGDQGYFEKDETLGYKTFKLEEIEGVVMANEFADLNTPQVLPEGKTQIQVEGEDDVRTLNYTTKITDIGESRLIYTQNVAKVLSIADTGKNTTKEYGASVDIRTAAKFRDASGLNETTNTEYYTNFEPTGYYTSDWRIEYTIWLDMTAAEAAAYTNDNGGRYLAGPTDSHTHTNGGATYAWYNYNKAIKAGDPITTVDMNNIYTIFTASNGIWGSNVDQILPSNEIGQVFVATQTKDDISDKISYNQFLDTYINPIVSDKNWNTSENGEWVKFIDNNGDGDAEYAFKTQYALTEAVSSYTNKAGDTVMQYSWDNTRNAGTDLRLQNFDDDDHTYQNWDYTVRYMKDDEAVERDVAVGDIVLAAYIDNQYLVSDAESVTTEATNYNYKADEIIAADGNTYGQSGIWNATTMQNLLASMAPKTTYEMFLDKFGFVRAYRLPGGVQYALVTELYYNNNNNGNLVQNWPMTVELTMPDENGKAVTNEYSLTNASGNAFIATAPWTYISNYSLVSPLQNWLQPAIAHLGVTWTGWGPTRVAPTLGDADMTFWGSNRQLIRSIDDIKTSTEFNYDRQYYTGITTTTNGNPVPANPTVSFTNVAAVNVDGTSAIINGAAQVSLNQSGIANGYAVDYIQLDRTKDVTKGSASFSIGGSDAYKLANNYIVNADKDTEIYVVYNGGVEYFKGYANMPALTNAKNNIHAAYAVARNTNTGNNERNYWIADVIVYEVEKWDDMSKTSISLAYYTAFQQMQSANGVTIDTLNSKTDPAKVQLTPSGLAWGTTNNWWSSWGYNAETGFGWNTTGGTGYGFYQLWDETAPVDGVMTAAAIQKITEKYGESGIFAGRVTREVGTAVAGGYIPVNMSGATKANGTLATEALLSIADGKVYSVTDESQTNWTSQYRYYEANTLQYNNSIYSEVKADDYIVWVGGGTKGTVPNSASFIVDLGNQTTDNDLLNNTKLWSETASWLKDLWNDIWDDQNPNVNYKTVTIKHVTGATTSSAGTAVPGVEDTVVYVKNGTNWVVTADDLALTGTGYTFANEVFKENTVGATPFAATAITVGYDKTYGIDNVTKDEVVYVNYTNTGYSLKVVGAGSYTSTAAATTYNANGVNQDQAATALSAGGFTLTGTAGADFTVTITPAAGEIITVADIAVTGIPAKDYKVTANNNGTFTVTGKVNGAVVVTVTAATSRTITVGKVQMATGDNSGTPILTDVENAATISVDKNAVVNSTGTATVTVAPAAGYRVVKVSATNGTVTANANGTYTLSSVTANTTVNAQVAYTISTSGGNVNALGMTDTTVGNGEFTDYVMGREPGVYTVSTNNGFWANDPTQKDAWSIVQFIVKTTQENESVSFTITKTGETTPAAAWSYEFASIGAHGCYEQVILDQYGKIDGSKLDPTPLTPGTYNVTMRSNTETWNGTITVG